MLGVKDELSIFIYQVDIYKLTSWSYWMYIRVNNHMAGHPLEGYFRSNIRVSDLVFKKQDSLTNYMQ